MEIQNKIKYCLTVLLVQAVGYVFAQQNFRYSATLPPVNTDDFYRINLQPSLLAKCKADLADIRLVDEKRKSVPYIFGNQLPAKQQQFVAFPQVAAINTKDSLTTLIAENKDRLIINQLVVQLRNTAVERMLNLSGSNDLKNWYGIKEGIILANADIGGDKKDFYEQPINFPASRYRYLKIQVNNKNKAPVELLNAGIYRTSPFNPGYTPLVATTFSQRDSANISTVFIKFNEAYQINKLQGVFTGQKYFKRAVRIYQLSGKTFDLVADTIISSADTGGLYLSAKTTILKMEIINGDNPPLILKSVTGYQLKQSLISYLEQGHQYQLLVGNPVAEAPDYDIKFFADSFNRQLKPLEHGRLIAQSFKPDTIKKNSIPTWAIWVAIVAAIITLLALTVKMTKEIGTRSE